MAVVAVRAVYVTVIMAMVMIVIAVWAVNMVLLGHAVLLRDVIARNYLAIARHVHALSKQPTRFDSTLEAIRDRFVGFIQCFDDLSQVPPEVGAYGNGKVMVAVGGYGEGDIGFSLRQFHIIQVHNVIDTADGQAEVVWVVDTKAQREPLLKQLGFDDVDFNEPDIR